MWTITIEAELTRHLVSASTGRPAGVAAPPAA
jgi:hypothetical protein